MRNLRPLRSLDLALIDPSSTVATGFDLSEGGLGINVIGRNDQSVTEQWAEQGGPQAYLGTTLAGFPNFMLILGPNVASGSASVVYSTEAQVRSPLLQRWECRRGG